MITGFSDSLLNNTEYIVNVSSTPTRFIAARAPRIARGAQILTASEATARRRNVGVSNNAFDLLNFADSTLDLGVLSSNGFRYNYLAFNADVNPSCFFIESNKSIAVTDQTNAGNFIIDQEIVGGKIIKAYVGNPVVPLPRSNNNISTTFPRKLKVPRILVNNNCP
jgi:hypothetical protein